MDTVIEAIYNTPIIDHHAHNLLHPSELAQHPLLAITSEAAGPALDHAKSTLAHLRAVKQLSGVLGCEATWEAVEARIKEENDRNHDAWTKRCFQQIETVLVDDGLNERSVFPFAWHDRLTRSKCKRILRIEREAEQIFQKHIALVSAPLPGQHLKQQFYQTVQAEFALTIKEACANPEVVAFKSVICYRSGLDVPLWADINENNDVSAFADGLLEVAKGGRLEHERVGPVFLHWAVRMILTSVSSTGHPKPLQFHTGLGDNDISLRLSNPSYLQPFIKEYPNLPIVLLHASYPFTREAGYLATVYENVYLDVGEVFPFISQDGQERVIAQALELCPSEKLNWSTDGHWFPETYLVAIMQVREAMEQVLGDYLKRGALDATQACRTVQDLFFNTSNRLYKLNLTLSPLAVTISPRSLIQITPAQSLPLDDLSLRPDSFSSAPDFMDFFTANPDINYLRVQWLDYTSTLRVRNLAVPHALSLFQKGKFVGIVNAVFGLLQNDLLTEGCGVAVGEYKLVPIFDSLRRGPEHDGASYATVMCEFREQDGSEVPMCPRTCLRRIVQRAKQEKNVDFLVGFETEVVFTPYSNPTFRTEYVVFGGVPVSQGHCWSSARALDRSRTNECLETIAAAIQKSGIALEQFQAEAAPGQYEFVTGPLPPLAAVDALITTRDIIQRIAMEYDLRATFHPKPVLGQVGSGQHIHLSMTMDGQDDHAYMSFYAGVLTHLRALCAFTYPLPESYTRVGDSLWAGGRYVAWGRFNRETPLRQIDASHWEVRFMDGFANPYLALAAILAAGYRGLATGYKMHWGNCDGDPSRLSEEAREELGIEEMLPRSAEEAWAALEQDDALREAVGRKAADYHLRVKRHETEVLCGMEEERRRNWLIERY